MEPEFRAMGLACPPVRERQAALAEALQVVPPLLRGQTVSYRGAHCQVAEVTLQPPPVQQPYVPLVVAGGGERTTLRLVGHYAAASNLAADARARPEAAVLRTYHFCCSRCQAT